MLDKLLHDLLIRFPGKFIRAASYLLFRLYRPLRMDRLFVVPLDRALPILRRRLEEIEADEWPTAGGDRGREDPDARPDLADRVEEEELRMAEHGLVPAVSRAVGLEFARNNLLAGLLLLLVAVQLCPPGQGCGIGPTVGFLPSGLLALLHLSVAAFHLGVLSVEAIDRVCDAVGL